MMTRKIQFFNAYPASVTERYEFVALAFVSKSLLPSVFESFFENDAGEISYDVQSTPENLDIKIKYKNRSNKTKLTT